MQNQENIIELLENLDALANQLDRSYTNWQERNTSEALAMKNAVDSRIIELNASIGFSFYK